MTQKSFAHLIQDNVDQTVALLEQGVVQTIPRPELLEKIASRIPLRIKLGMDPTSPDLHLGHAVVLSKMKQFQDLGHELIFVIGDFTARIGDPTGKSKTRPPLEQSEIEHNMKTYLDQVGKILDLDKMNVVYNSSWLDKLSAKDLIQLCGKVTLARIIERDDFAQRMARSQTIGFHELLYPLFQGYDSVVLKADIELGGTDQTFNLVMGRFLQEQYGVAPQLVMTVPLLEGLDGVHKMSKSLGNAIGIAESADQAFGKLMSISDLLMWRYYSLLLAKSDADIVVLKQGVKDGTQHPMKLKKEMAHGIVARFWSLSEADNALKVFEELFQKKDYSNAQAINVKDQLPNPVGILDLLKHIGAVKSSSEGRRLIEGKAVYIDGALVTDLKQELLCTPGTIIKVGKHRIYKIQ